MSLDTSITFWISLWSYLHLDYFIVVMYPNKLVVYQFDATNWKLVYSKINKPGVNDFWFTYVHTTSIKFSQNLSVQYGIVWQTIILILGIVRPIEYRWNFVTISIVCKILVYHVHILALKKQINLTYFMSQQSGSNF